jgi:hypothetical protein
MYDDTPYYFFDWTDSDDRDLKAIVSLCGIPMSKIRELREEHLKNNVTLKELTLLIPRPTVLGTRVEFSDDITAPQVTKN